MKINISPKIQSIFYSLLILILIIFQGYIIGQFGILGIALPLGIALFLLVFCNLNTALLVVFLSIFTGQIARINFSSSNGGILASDIIIPMFLLSWLSYKLVKSPKFYKTPITFSLLIFFCWLIITYIIALTNYNNLSALLYLVRLLMYFSLFWPFYDILKNQQSYNFGLKIFEGLMYSLVVVGLVQLAIFPNLKFLMAYGWDPHLNRMVSTFLDPNFLAGFLNIGFAYFLAKFYSSEKPFYEKIWPLIIIGLGVALTVSRSGWIMMAIILFLFALLKDRKLFIIIAIILILVVQFVPRFSQRITEGFNFQQSAALRLENWRQGYELIQKNFVLGIGYNNLEEVKYEAGFISQSDLQGHHSASGLDSSLMVIWSTTGIIGLIIFLYFILKNIYLVFKAFFRSKSLFTANLGLAVAGIFIGLLAHSIFTNSLFYPYIIIGYMFILAVFYVLREKDEKNT